MSLMEYLKKFQGNELVKDQIQGKIWEETITTMYELREIHTGDILTDALQRRDGSSQENSKRKTDGGGVPPGRKLIFRFIANKNGQHIHD